MPYLISFTESLAMLARAKAADCTVLSIEDYMKKKWRIFKRWYFSSPHFSYFSTKIHNFGPGIHINKAKKHKKITDQIGFIDLMFHSSTQVGVYLIQPWSHFISIYLSQQLLNFTVKSWVISPYLEQFHQRLNHSLSL